MVHRIITNCTAAGFSKGVQKTKKLGSFKSIQAGTAAQNGEEITIQAPEGPLTLEYFFKFVQYLLTD